MTRRRPPRPETPSLADSYACPGKVPFVAERVAKQRAREIRESDGSDMHAYRCTACGWWHLGHKAGQGAGIRYADRLYQIPPQIQPAPEGEF